MAKSDWYDYLWNPLLPFAAGQDALSSSEPETVGKKQTGPVVVKAQTVDEAKKILEVLFAALPKAAWNSTTCLAEKVGWVKMAATFAAAYWSGQWGAWIALVKPHTCECAIAKHLNIIPKTGATAGLYAAAKDAAESGCAMFGQSLENKCKCQDPAMWPIMQLPHVQADPVICAADCATISENFGIAAGTSDIVGAQAAAAAAKKIQAQSMPQGARLLVLAALAYAVARKGG